MKISDPIIFIVDDDLAVRDSLRMLVRRLGLRIQTYPSAEAFLEEYTSDAPGCLVLDMSMGGMTGLDLQKQLLAQGAGIPIIFITGYGDVSTAVQATKSGAIDFIEKPFDPEVLLERIRDAIERDTKMRQARAQNDTVLKRLRSLSPREHEVMRLVISGKTSREIAQKLCRSEKTIKAHRLHLMKKLHTRTSTEMVRMALTAQKDLGRADWAQSS